MKGFSIQWTYGRNALLVFSILTVGVVNGRAADNVVFKEMCSVCHGVDGKGDTQMGKTLKVPVLSSPAVQKQTDAELTKTITTGKNKMPAIGNGLKPEEVKNLVVFIRGLGKKK